jgi:hypothetical protein
MSIYVFLPKSCRKSTWHGAKNALDNGSAPSRERYMSPHTIKTVMEGLKMYHN